jgi:hypothetical protein
MARTETFPLENSLQQDRHVTFVLNYINMQRISNPDVTDVQKSATEFVKGLRSRYPKLRRFRVKKCENVWFIRANYGDRRLYACNETPEEAFIHFFHEINQKVLLQPYRDRATIRAERRMNAV